jgi:uncharacterized protein YegJ (DUF2314 family)
MKDTILTIVAITAIFVGLPLLICWCMDRRGVASILVKRVLGAVSLAVGVALCVWVVYNQFFPTDAFKGNFHSAFQLIFPIVCLILGWKWVRYEGKAIADITPPDLDCPELTASVEAARKSLPTFLTEVDKGIDGAYVKFPITTPRGLTEHIWGYVHFYRDGQFNVSIANDPYDDEEDDQGRRNIPRENVEDWQIMQPDGNIKGAYSLIALFRYHESRGVKLSPLMKKQKAQLLDAE